MPIAEEHVVAVCDLDNRRQCLAFVCPEAVADQLAAFLFGPADAVFGCSVGDFIDAIGRNVSGEALPFDAEDVPHVERIADDLYEAVADEARFMERGGEYWSVSD